MRWITGLVVVGLLSSPALAKTLRVPKDFATIGAAVAAAKPNDIIQVSAGTYSEAVVLDGVQKVGLLAKGTVVIDGGSGARDGIAFRNSTLVAVRGFTFTGCRNGIVVENSNRVSVTRCVVQAPTGDGIQVTSSSFVGMSDDTVEQAGGSGIVADLGTGSPQSRLSRLTIRNAAIDGLRISGDNSPVTDILVEGAGSTGVSTNGSKSRVKNCRVVDVGTGIQTFGARSFVQHGSVRNANNGGIVTRGDDSYIYDTNVTATSGNGLETFGARSPIRQCVAARISNGHGASTHGADSHMDRVRVTNVSNVGIVTAAAGGHVKLSRVLGFGNAQDGIQVLASGSDVTNCTVKDCRQFGIAAYGGGGTFLKNDVANVGTTGIEVTTTGNTFQQNTVTASVGDGIHVSASSNTFKKNKATGNAVLDLRDDAGGNTYTANTFGTTNL